MKIMIWLWNGCLTLSGRVNLKLRDKIMPKIVDRVTKILQTKKQIKKKYRVNFDLRKGESLNQ